MTRGCFRARVFLPVLILFAALSAPPAGEGAQVEGIRNWSYDDYSRVVIDLSGPASFDKNSLANPPRLYIDLKYSNIAGGMKPALPVGDGILRNVRAAQYDEDTVRVVLDLEHIKDYKVFQLTDPYRLVVDVYGEGGETKGPAGGGEERTIKRVVIDPGHGGHDPGAIGPGGLQEKDVVLDIALELKGMLEAEGYEVLLTRDRDVYLDLEERTIFANRENADLFVSIHANASPRQSAKGLETYMLNWTDDEEAQKVAARENSITLKRMKQARSDIGLILASLELQNKRDESLKLAHYIQRSMMSSLKGRYGGIEDHGVKQALFYVLFGAKMPSVLVEVSYISNPVEATRLQKKAYRQHLAQGIASGVKAYFAGAPSPQTVAKR
jgi:N-acetylmuramoyl-L-alanine amidase